MGVTMTDTDMRAYALEQLETIERDETDAHQTIRQLRDRLIGLAGARRAYEDVIAEIDKRQAAEQPTSDDQAELIGPSPLGDISGSRDLEILKFVQPPAPSIPRQIHPTETEG